MIDLPLPLGVAALLAAGIILAACGGSSENGGSTMPSTAASGTGGGAGSAGSGATTGQGGAGTGGAGQGGDSCPVIPACAAPPPDPGPPQAWKHSTTPLLVTSMGSPNHRGRDLFLNPGDPQWIIGKFAYGLIDKDLKDEAVDIYLLRDCAASWEQLGTALTTDDAQHPTVEGVEDTGGRIYFQIPPDKTLGLGRHRVRLVVQGDLSVTELFIEVVPAGTVAFVSDVDGTLTTYETEEFVVLLTGSLPDANPNAAAALTALAERGVRPFYLTARPEWLVERTREFLLVLGFPPGIIHTTQSKVGALGGEAASYKTTELLWLSGKGIAVSYAFGNTDSDGEAYDNTGIQPLDHRIFFQFDDPFGGRRIEDYGELIAELSAFDGPCP